VQRANQQQHVRVGRISLINNDIGMQSACQMHVICRNQFGKLCTSAIALAILAYLLCGLQSQADAATDASLSGQVVDDFGVPVTNINVFAVGQDGATNTFSAPTDGNGNFQMSVVGGSYLLQLDTDPDAGVLSRGLVSPRVFESISSGATVTNISLVARRITGSITVTLLNGGKGGFHGGLVAKSTINPFNSSVITDSFDSTDTNYWTNNLYDPTKRKDTNAIPIIGDTNLILNIYDTNLIYGPIYVPTNSFDPTNFIGATNLFPPIYSTNHFTFHYDETLVSNKGPITNIEVTADLLGSVPTYVVTPQRTDTNGIAVLYVCDGSWSLHPDCGALDALKFDCQIYKSNVVTVVSTNVAITLWYFTNAPLEIGTNMVAGTNGLPYNAWMYTTGGYWPFTWSIISGTLPPGLATNQNSANQLTGLPTQEGAFTFTVQVTDNLQRTATTNLTINILPTPPPKLNAPLCSNASQFQLHLAGLSNRNYTIQFTTDLMNWTTLAVTNVMGPDTIFVDTNSGDAMRIYRVLQGP
jgi:hypothetical protein